MMADPTVNQIDFDSLICDERDTFRCPRSIETKTTELLKKFGKPALQGVGIQPRNGQQQSRFSTFEELNNNIVIQEVVGGRKLKILIVDDFPTNLFVINMLIGEIKDQEIDSTTAINGLEAVKTI